MEANWCKREDTEDKETTEIITKALMHPWIFTLVAK